MLANRVQESSTTTGVGPNLTLAGTTAGFQTFTSQFAVNDRFTYTIENISNQWEIGVGYLSSSTVLVREEVLENSAGTTAKIDFTGTLTVFVSVTTFERNDVPYVTADVRSEGTRFDGIMGGSTYTTLTAVEGGIFIPVMCLTGRVVSSLGVAIASGASDNINTRIAIYALSESGLPGKVLATTAALAATADNVLLFGSVTTFFLPEGPYYAACLTETVTTDVTFKGTPIESSTCSWPGSEGFRPRADLVGAIGARVITSFLDNPTIAAEPSGAISAIPDMRTKP